VTRLVGLGATLNSTKGTISITTAITIKNNKIALSPVIRDEDKIPLISLAVREEERD
jgi:hypothetical protein